MSDWESTLSPEERAHWNDFVRAFRADALKKMDESAFVAQIVPGEGEWDVKFATELGAAIMLDKPILAIVAGSRKPPGKLLQVADEVVYADVDTSEGRAKIAESIKRMQERLP